MTDILVRALLRTRFNSFVHKTFNTVSPGTAYMHNWHIDAIVHQLMRVSSGLERRLLINQPPRSLKSICVLALAAEYEAATVLIEDAGPGLQLLQDLRSNLPKGWSYPIGMKPEGSKPERMAAQSAKIEAGHVILPKEAHWLDTFLTEVLAFPNGRHDDQVDSLSQFLIWAQQDGYRSNIAMTGPIIVTAPRDDHWSPPVNW